MTRNQVIEKSLNEIYSNLEVGQTQVEIEEYIGNGRTIKITQSYRLCRYFELISDIIPYQTKDIGTATGRVKCYIEIKYKKGKSIEIIKKGIDGIFNKTIEESERKEINNDRGTITWEEKLLLGYQTYLEKENFEYEKDERLINYVKKFCYDAKEVSFAQTMINFPEVEENRLMAILWYLERNNVIIIDVKSRYSPVKKTIIWNANKEIFTEDKTDNFEEKDERFIDVGKLITREQNASIGMIQRTFALGFNRAARIIDQLECEGVISKQDGKKPREVLMTIEEFEKRFVAKENESLQNIAPNNQKKSYGDEFQTEIIKREQKEKSEINRDLYKTQIKQIILMVLTIMAILVGMGIWILNSIK